MINRSKNDILAEMLGALEKYGETSRTRIMYHAMLSNDQCKAYILFLLEKGLAANSTDKHKPTWLVITDKGRELLRVIREMNRMVDFHDDNTIYPDHIIPIPPPSAVAASDIIPISTSTQIPVHPTVLKQKPKPVGKELMETAQLMSDKVRERRKVKVLWENGLHSDTKIAKVLSLTRGVVYNHLRGLGLKPKTSTKKG